MRTYPIVATSLAAALTCVLFAATAADAQQGGNPAQAVVPPNKRPPDPLKKKAPPATKFPPAFARAGTAPVVFGCPSPSIVAEVNAAGAPAYLTRTMARMNGKELVCDYTLPESVMLQVKADTAGGKPTCPATVEAKIVGPKPNTTADTGYGCAFGGAWCHGPANAYKGLTLASGPTAAGICNYHGGSITLGTNTEMTCITGVGGNNSPTGKFICY